MKSIESMQDDMIPACELDARGLSCPLPVLRTKKAMDALSAGQVLKVVTTDPGSQNDLASWARWTGNRLLRSDSESGTFTFFIQKSTKG